MKKNIISIVILLFMIIPLVSNSGIAQDNNEIVWSNEQLISGKFTVNEGEVLIIKPGTVVRFDEDASLYIKGTMKAVGTNAKPISFKSNSDNPIPGIWDKINFKSSATADCIMRNCKIEYAAQGISISAPYVTIESNIFSDVEKYGIKIAAGTSYIANNTITTQNIAIRVADFAEPEIYNNTMLNNDFYGIYSDNNAKPIIIDNYIENTEWGIYSHLAEPKVIDNTITDCTFGVQYYLSTGTIEKNIIQKSVEYGIKCKYADPKIINNTITNSGKAGIFAYHSQPVLQDNIISNSELWGILSLGESSGLKNNELNTIEQNKRGQIRQGWYLSFNIKDSDNKPIRNIDISIKDQSNQLVFNGNTGVNDTFTIDLTEFVIQDDGSIVEDSEYTISIGKDGYKGQTTKVSMDYNKELILSLEAKSKSDKSSSDGIPGFGFEITTMGVLMIIFFIWRRKSKEF